MRIARNLITFLFFIFFSIAVLGGLFWINLNLINHVPGGADFIVPWKAMQNFMMKNVTPYGELTGLNIQTLIYQQPLPSGAFPYHVNIPLFMLIFYLPFAWIDNLALARAIFMILLELAVLGVVFVSLRLARWREPFPFLLVLLFFGAFWLPTVNMLLTSTAIILQALVLFGALLALEYGSDELGGALAALGLLNIEASGMVFLLLLLWVITTQRWRVLGGMAMTLTLLLVLSFLLMPGWLLPFLGATISNWRSGLIPSTYTIIQGWLPGIGFRLSQILSMAALALLMIEWWAARGQSVRWLFWTACFTSVLTPLLGVPYFPQMLVFTLPAVLLVVAAMIQRWKLVGYFSSLVLLLGLFFGLWQAFELQITSAFVIFYPVLMILLLYWVRWGAIHQPHLWVDEIMMRG